MPLRQFASEIVYICCTLKLRPFSADPVAAGANIIIIIASVATITIIVLDSIAVSVAIAATFVSVSE